jgi:nitroreductase
MVLEELLRARFGLDLKVDLAEPIDPALARVLGRRTHRRYADSEVPDGVLDLLLYAALSAPSKSDFQQVSIIKVKDAAKRAAIARHFPSMPWIAASPAFLVFCGDARRLDRICSLRNHPRPNADLEAFLNASVDAALALQSFIVSAEAIGLGCCPISVIRNQLPSVAEALKLPDGVFPVAGLCVGYPAGPGYTSMRLPPTVTIHTDEYQDSDLEREVDAYDQRRHERHAIAKEQQRAPAKFGYTDFYRWSEDKARQAAAPEGDLFADYLRKSWFSF